MLLTQYNMGGSYLEPSPLLKESNIENTLKKLNYSIVDLLPQNNSALVRDSKMASEIFKLIYHIINLLADCLHQFYIRRNYQYFDPHVGENACQIRAYAFVILAEKKYEKDVIINRIHFLNAILDKLKKILVTPINYKKSSCTIIELFKKHECYFSVEWQECFLCKSYTLTLFRKSNHQTTYTCSYTLAHFFKISKKSSEKIIRQYQLHLAIMSCQFVQTIAFDLNLNEKNNPSIVSSILYDDDGRMVYPCFFSSRIFLMHMKKTRCAVLIILETLNGNKRKDFILFDKDNNQGRLLTRDKSHIKEDLCIVVIGARLATTPLSSSELLKKLNYFGLYSILLMNMAAHPQLSGSKLSPFANQFVPDCTKLTTIEKEMEAEFWTLESTAHKYGFCRDNPSVLLIKHIFMSTIKNQINLQNTNEYTRSVRDSIDI
jgi:hypothetical protein